MTDITGDTAPYCFADEIKELMTVVDGKICGYEVSEEMERFFRLHGEAVIAFCKRTKKKYDEENRERLF